MSNARTAKSAREKAAQLRQEAERQAARRRALIAGGLVLLLIAVAVGVTIFVRSLPTHSATPGNLSDGGIVSGAKDAKVTVEVYEDFQCPICKEFEQATGPTLDGYAKDTKVRVIYRPVAILDRASSTNYSTRALNAFAAVVNTTPSAAAKMREALFANQPAEGSEGLPDSKLVEFAVAAGAPKDAMEKAVKERPYREWTVEQSDALSKRFPPGGTPTVVVNGTKLDNPTVATITAAVTKAEAS